jgi:hypothetical protein
MQTLLIKIRFDILFHDVTMPFIVVFRKVILIVISTSANMGHAHLFPLVHAGFLSPQTPQVEIVVAIVCDI